VVGSLGNLEELAVAYCSKRTCLNLVGLAGIGLVDPLAVEGHQKFGTCESHKREGDGSTIYIKLVTLL
jgi:hypothetical protein